MERTSRIGILATGGKEYDSPRGSTCEGIITARLKEHLSGEIAFLASTHKEGSIRRLAEEYAIPFEYIDQPKDPWLTYRLNEQYQTRLLVLAGYMRIIQFPENRPVPTNILNTHPALQPEFDGLHGDRVHELVAEAIQAGRVKEFGYRVHFVGREVDQGPTIFRCIMPSVKDLTAEAIKRHVKANEQQGYPMVIDQALRCGLTWDGETTASFTPPAGHKIDFLCPRWE